MKKGLKITLYILFIVVLGAFLYFWLFFNYSCDTLSCFQAHQEKCTRTKYVFDSETSTWVYLIKGKEKGMCEIQVEIIQVKEGTIDNKKLEGKKMSCLMPFGSIETPESDLSICHGLLKEQIQEIMIKNAHAMILKNLGEIGEELKKVI